MSSLAHDTPPKMYDGIGLMSGTSLDGIDLVFCRFWEKSSPAPDQPPWEYKILKAKTVPMPAKWHDRLYCLDTQSAETYAKTDIYFGHFLGEVIRDFIQKEGIKPQFVASHGQTIFHQPEKTFTAQIGDGETISSYLDVPLVTNFRNKDVALGGQGAPLVPFGEVNLFSNDHIFLNLGGIANLTIGTTAFDVCVCNMALNWLAGQLIPACSYDNGGEIAAGARVNKELLNLLDSLPWYELAPPKSLGKEWFEGTILPLLNSFPASTQEKMRTYVEHIAGQIALSIYQTQSAQAANLKDPSNLLATGGGVHHSLLMSCIQARLLKRGLEIQIKTDPQLIDYKEALIFAFLGLNTLLRRPNVLASVTGARMGAVSGSVHLPPKGGLEFLF